MACDLRHPSQLDRGLQRLRERRCPRGPRRPGTSSGPRVAAQSLFVALLLAAANLRKIATFVQEQAAIEAGTLRRLPRRRTTKSIGDWLPEAPKVEPASGPDPPMIA